MDLSDQILFFLAGLGVFNGTLLAIYFLFVVRPQRWVNVLFGLFLLMICIRVGKSVFYIFTEVPRIYRQIGLSACIMIGPLLWVYVRSFMEGQDRPKRSDLLFLSIPLTTILVIGWIWPYETYPAYWNYRIIHLIYGVWIAFTLASCLLIFPLRTPIAKGGGTAAERWLVLVVACNLFLCTAYNLAYYGFPYLSGPLLFSLVFYVLTLFLVRAKNRILVLQLEPPKQQKQKVSTDKANELLDRLAGIMNTERPYLNPNIKLAHVAQMAEVGSHELSHVINDRLEVSFNHYINEYRVKASCILLQEADHLTIEGIGQEVGFNSRSAFYKAFKTVMQQTPRQYQMQFKELEEQG